MSVSLNLDSKTFGSDVYGYLLAVLVMDPHGRILQVILSYTIIFYYIESHICMLLL